MCLVLDANAFSLCFDASNAAHSDFRPVLDWLVHGKGKLVYGGNKYKKELKDAGKYLRFFVALNRAGKTVCLDDTSVDEIEKEVRDIEPSEKFDDPHLIAIILKSKCNIICTKDMRAKPYLKDSRFYLGITSRPKLYTSKKNASLLTDKYIADICRPCERLNKKDASAIFSP